MKSSGTLVMNPRGIWANASAHSTQDRVSMRSRLKVQFQDKNIAAFRYKMASYKDTIYHCIGPGFSECLTSTHGRLLPDLDFTQHARCWQLEETTDSTGIALASQIKGMDISIQTLMGSGLSTSGGDNDCQHNIYTPNQSSCKTTACRN